MLYWTTVLVMLSNSGTPTAEELLEKMDASLEAGSRRIGDAPPVPIWPKGLPDPIILQPGQMLPTSNTATCYPHPTDFVLDYHLLHWETYPGWCQRRLNASWAAYEDLEKYADKAIETALQATETPPAHPTQLWQDWLIVGAVTLGTMGGFLLGWGLRSISHE